MTTSIAIDSSIRICGRILSASEALRYIRDSRKNGGTKVERVREILAQKPVEQCIKFIPDFDLED